MSTDELDFVVQEKLIEETRTWYISDEVLQTLELSLTNTIHGILSIVGVLTNTVNAVIFVKLGLRNSISVGLFMLSMTDILVTALQLSICSSYLVYYLYTDFRVHPLMLGGYLFSWTRYIAYLVSCWITTTISIERCFCVVFPFKVRKLFTRARCIWTIFGIYFVHIVIPFPLFVYAKLVWVTTEAEIDNVTYPTVTFLTVIFNDDSVRWEILSDTIIGIILSILSQIILFICTIWMIFSLKASANIRRSSDSDVAKVKTDKSVKNVDYLSPKERRMSKAVLFLAVVLSICNIPRFVATAVHHTLPGMNKGAYQNLEKFLWELAYFFGTLCCTSNIVVYLNLNSQYRQMFKQILSIKYKAKEK